MDKTLTVVFGKCGDLQPLVVKLNGVMACERLTPKMAVRAAKIACGHRSGVDVFDNGGYYYRLYRRSARKVYYQRP